MVAAEKAHQRTIAWPGWPGVNHALRLGLSCNRYHKPGEMWFPAR